MRTINQLFIPIIFFVIPRFFVITSFTLLFCWHPANRAMQAESNAAAFLLPPPSEGYIAPEHAQVLQMASWLGHGTGEYDLFFSTFLDQSQKAKPRIKQELESALLENDSENDSEAVAHILKRENWLADRTKEELFSPIMCQAILDGKCEIARMLLAHKADPNLAVDSLPILLKVAYGGSPEAVACLLDAKADPTRKLGMNALEWGMCNDKHFLPITQLLIARVGLAPFEAPGIFEHSSRCLLHTAAKKPDRCRLVALLLDNHVDPNLKSPHGETVLDLACMVIKASGNFSSCYVKESPFKIALLLYSYGAITIQENLTNYFSPAEIELMQLARARRRADIAYITKFLRVEQQASQAFKVSYNSTLARVLLHALTGTPQPLISLVTEYAEYHPELADYSPDPDLEKHELAPVLVAAPRKDNGCCSIQ